MALGALVLASPLSLAPALGASDSAPPRNARLLSAFELLKIFGGKTWKWGEGGGYFVLEGRRFLGRSVSTDGIATAEGKWQLTDTGVLCIKAKWVAAGVGYPAATCFQHVEADDQIYQRKLPDGRWYVFRHAKPEQGDEFNNLVGGNLISAAHQQAERTLSE